MIVSKIPRPWLVVFDDPFMAAGDLSVLFMEFETTVLCKGAAPELFESGLEVLFLNCWFLHLLSFFFSLSGVYPQYFAHSPKAGLFGSHGHLSHMYVRMHSFLLVICRSALPSGPEVTRKFGHKAKAKQRYVRVRGAFRAFMDVESCPLGKISGGFLLLVGFQPSYRVQLLLWISRMPLISL
jgi:hypothetical protein